LRDHKALRVHKGFQVRRENEASKELQENEVLEV
jgi:hypothetical protein